MKRIIVACALSLLIISLLVAAFKTLPPHHDDVPLPATFTLRCAPLSAFDPDDWEQVQRAFSEAEPGRLEQAWLQKPQTLFRPAEVRVGRVEQTLWVYAELSDDDIFNPATQLNQPTYELGDAFEMFLRPLPQGEYYELHVSPHNQKYQLHFPTSPRPSELQTVDEELFQSRTQIVPQQKMWRVLASIPIASICRKGQVETGDEWIFSFSRYDYTRGQERPVLSSTSPHRRLDFHRQQEWGRLLFVE